MHARCPISAVFGHYGCRARPPSCRPSWLDPGDPSDDLRSRSLFPLTWDPCPRVHLCWGKRIRTWVPPYIKLVKYSIRVETPLTPISHPIPNQPDMEADTCGFFMASEVSLHSAETYTPTGSQWLIFYSFSLPRMQKPCSMFFVVFFLKSVLNFVPHTISILGI